MRATAALALLVRRAFFGVLVRLIAVVGGRGARYVRWVEFVPVSFWRRRFRRPKLPRPALPDLRLELLLLGVLLTATGSRWSDPEKWPDRPGNLPPLAGGTLRKVVAAGGKSNVAKTYEPEGIPTASDDVELAATSGSFEIAAALTVRSLQVASGYTKTVNGTGAIKLGSSTQKEDGYILSIQGGTWTANGSRTFVSTLTTEVQKVRCNRTKWPSACLFEGKGKYELTENLSAAETAEYIVQGEAGCELKLASGITLSAGAVSVRTPGTLALNKNTLTLFVKAPGSAWFVSGTVTGAVESTIELRGDESWFAEKAAVPGEYGTVTFGTAIAPVAVLTFGSWSVANITFNSGGKKVTFEKGKTITVTGTIATNSKAGSLVTFESSEAGKEFKIEFTKANTVKNVIVKDSVATGTEPVDEYEGEEATYKVGVTSGWKFKAIGGGAAVLELAAAKSESAASMALSAQTQLGFAAGVSSSAAVLSLQAPTQVGLAAALSASGATLGLSAPTQLALGAGVSSSTAAMALSAPTQLAFAAAASASSGTLGLRAPTQLVLGTGASTSSATMVLEVPSSAPKLVLAPAASASAASMGLQAATRLAFTTGQSFSSGALGLRAPAQLGLAAGVSTSSATFVLLTPSPAVLGLSPASSTSAGRLTLFTAASLVGLIFGEGGTMTLVGFGVGGTGASPSAAGGTEGAPLGAGGSMVASGAVGLGAIYWANADIGRAQLDGTGVTDSFILNGFAYGVATAPGAIFALVREGGLGRYPLSGGAGASDVELSPAWYGPNILATDDTYAYYGSKSAGHIERVRLDLASGSVQVLVTGVNPRGIAVSATKIFWTEWEGETARIFTAPKAGGAKTELPLPGFPEEQEPWGILVVGEHLFFSTVGVAGLGEHEGRVWRCGLDGTGIAGFVPLPSAHTPEWVLGSWAGPLATDGTFLYYGSMGAGGHKVGRIGLDDTGQSDFWLDVGEFVFALAVTPPGEAAVPGIASGAGGSLAGVFGTGGNR